MKLLEKGLVFALVFGVVFGLMSCSSDSGGNGSESVSIELPGVLGGISNSDDLFAGKTFTEMATPF